MANLTLQTNFDVASLLLGAFSAASVTATATSVTYTLGTKVISLQGAFTLSGSQPVSGSVTGMSYVVGGTSQFNVTGAGWTFAGFQAALANDDLSSLLSGADRVVGTSTANTLRGYAGDDLLSGGAGNDTMQGSYGNDTLDGGTGADSMQGGSGDDVYRVDSTSDRTVEYAGGGADRVDTSLASYTLAANVENLTYLGTGSFTGNGNAVDNRIVGGKGADSINGLGGNDVLRGGNGNDTVNGGDGNDWLIGDAGAASVTTTASRPSPSLEDVPLSLSMTMAEVATTTSTTVSGYINNATLGTGVFNLAFVMDVSGSMEESFTGATVGDVNGDGTANTKLDAAIASFKSLVASINAAGLGQSVRIGLIPFDSSSDIRAIGSGTSDANGNGIADVVDAALGLNELGGTSYDLGLENAVRFFNGSPAGDNHVFFLSDGAPNGGPYEGFLDQLRNDNGINATIRALGIEAGSAGYYDVLDQLDDGKLNDSAVNVTNPAGLTAGLLGANVDLADVKHLQIYKNGVLLTTLTASQLTETPFGLKYSYTVTGLSTTGTDQIETRLVLKDPAASVISTSQTITVGALASNDSLVGGAGNDTLDGGAGVDTLVGGLGNDTYRVDSTGDKLVEAANAGLDKVESAGSYSLNSGSAAQIEDLALLGSGATAGTGNALANRIQGNMGNNVLQGMGGNDTMDGGFGNDTVSYAAATQAVSVDLGTGTGTTGSEIDSLTGFEVVRGSAYGDSLAGDANANTFIGGAGNDAIDGAGGFDTVDYSAATSAVTVALNTSYYGGTATSANGAEGTDTIDYVEGVIGSAYADAISDGQYDSGLNNHFDGRAGNDTLRGGYGSDTLVGGTGSDILDGGANYSSSYPDVDVVDYSTATSAITGSLVGTMTGTSSGVDTLSNFEAIIATKYADKINGGTGAERFEGGAGADTLSGGSGNDTLIGGTGIDSMVGGAGDDKYLVDSASETLVESAGAGIDTVESTATFALAANVDNLVLLGTGGLRGTGNSLANAITGNAGANLLSGLAGNDSIVAGAGDDTVLGGTGADTLAGGEGIDVLSFADAGAASGTLNSTFTSSTGTKSVSGFEHMVGSAYGDNLTGDSYGNRIDGGAGNDTLGGGSGDDTLQGGAGNDVLDGGYGTDLISYAYLTTRGIVADLSTGSIVGDGTDTILETSIEAITGTGLNDRISWNSASTSTYLDFTLTGAAGNDFLQGSAGDDTLDGGTGADTMVGGAGYDTYMVDSASDVLTETASGGTDTVISSVSFTLGAQFEYLTLTGSAVNGTGNDLSNLLTGNSLANTLTGGLGSDTLVGGLGRDTLDGGLDTSYDIFRFASAADSKATAADRIANFNVAYDTIDLSGVDANSVAGSDQSFSFVGTGAFSGVAGQLRFQVSGAYTYIYGDTNGDKASDFTVVLNGTHALAAGDFYL